jgi:8-oxo-dGTP diphosphatase
MENTVQEFYGKKLRLRACGLCIQEDRLLLINHTSLTNGDFWAPPGGGIEFGETAETCVVREFREETGLDVAIGKFLFACEFIKDPLHAVELFFEVTRIRGSLKLGTDPEAGKGHQILHDLRFIPWQDIAQIKPEHLHGIFNFSHEPSQIMHLRGYFKL